MFSRWPTYLPGRTVVTAFRGDRRLSIAFLVMSIGALLPLFATPILPFPDLPSNVAGASLLVRTALHQSHASQFYRVQYLPLPYWTTYLVLGISSLAVGPLVAAKLVTALLVLLMPLALMRLLLAMGRDPRFALWGFLLSWDHNLYAGWHSYVLGMLISFIVLAKVIEAEDERSAMRVVPWSVVLALTHPLGLLFAAVAALLLVWRDGQPIRRLKLHAIALSGSVLVVVPWLFARTVDSEPGRSWLAVDYPSPSEKVATFFGSSIDVLRGSAAECVAVAALLLLLFGPLALACLPSNESRVQRWSGALVLLAAILLYAALPMSFLGPVPHWYTYPRFATYMLAAMLLVPPVRALPTWVLLPGMFVALAGNVVTFARFRSFGERVLPFLRIAEAVPGGAMLLPLEYVDDDPCAKVAPLAHLHSYISAKGAYDPHMFDSPSTPIRYRSDLVIPRISWFTPRDFALARYGPYYDYILVQGLKEDPFVLRPAEGGYRARLVREAGIWRLYALDKEGSGTSVAR